MRYHSAIDLGVQYFPLKLNRHFKAGIWLNDCVSSNLPGNFSNLGIFYGRWNMLGSREATLLHMPKMR